MDLLSPVDISCISPTSDPGERLLLEPSAPLLLGIPGASELSSFPSDDPFLADVLHPLLAHQLPPGLCPWPPALLL